MTAPDATARELAAFALQQVVVRLGCRLEGAADGVCISPGFAREIVHAAERGVASLSDDSPAETPEPGANPLNVPAVHEAMIAVLRRVAEARKDMPPGRVSDERADDWASDDIVDALAPYVAAARRAAFRLALGQAALALSGQADEAVLRGRAGVADALRAASRGVWAMPIPGDDGFVPPGHEAENAAEQAERDAATEELFSGVDIPTWMVAPGLDREAPWAAAWRAGVEAAAAFVEAGWTQAAPGMSRYDGPRVRELPSAFRALPVPAAFAAPGPDGEGVP